VTQKHSFSLFLQKLSLSLCRSDNHASYNLALDKNVHKVVLTVLYFEHRPHQVRSVQTFEKKLHYIFVVSHQPFICKMGQKHQVIGGKPSIFLLQNFLLHKIYGELKNLWSFYD